MINIGICDDDLLVCSHLESILKSLQTEFHIMMNIEIFYDDEKFIQRINELKDFDLIFLDIELKHELGSDIGLYIRDVLKWEKLSIIYISHQSRYAMSLFKTRPYDFIIKPISYENVKETMDRFLALYQHNHKIFKYRKGKSFHKVNIEDILYFESSNKMIYIHCINQIYSFYGKLIEVSKELQDLEDNFIYIHHSYLINYEHVSIFHYDSVQMINGDILPISQSKRSEIRKMQLERWVNKKK